jgi:hypothetical protein
MPLRINGKDVHKISGPVSMYVVVPITVRDLSPEDKSKASKFPNLPIYILFGDVHDSGEKTCEEGNFNIYDTKFLSLFSNIVQGDETVDFYVEGGDVHGRTFSKEIHTEYPANKIWKIASTCYKNKRPNEHKITYEQKSIDRNDIVNIRWQSGDIRSFENLKYEQFEPNCGMYKFINMLSIIFRQKPEEGRRFEKDDFRIALSNVAKSKTTRKIIPGCFRKLTGDTFKHCIDIKSKVFPEDRTKSLISKQLGKIPEAQSRLIEGFISQYIDTVIKPPNSREYDNFRGIHSTILDTIMNVNNLSKKDEKEMAEINIKENLRYLNRPENLRYFRLYFNYLVSIYSIVIDIYTFCRSFKYLYSEDSSKPLINIIYYGDMHIYNMLELFRITGLYGNIPVVEATVDKDASRCIEIKGDVDLDGLISLVRESRKEQPVQVSFRKRSGRRSRRSGKKSGRRSRRKSTRRSGRKSPRKSKRRSKRR